MTHFSPKEKPFGNITVVGIVDMGLDGEPEKEIVMQMMKVNTVNISIGSNIKILFPGHSDDI